MKTLNKYMVNKIAGLLKLAIDGQWLKIELMLSALKNYGVEWDPCEYDTNEIDMIFKHRLGIWEDDENSTNYNIDNTTKKTQLEDQEISSR